MVLHGLCDFGYWLEASAGQQKVLCNDWTGHSCLHENTYQTQLTEEGL